MDREKTMTSTQQYTYRIEIEWDQDSKVYLAKVPDLRGLITHGDTYEEALQLALEFIPVFHEVIDEREEYIKGLEDALEFYANSKKRIGLIKTDMGAVAREALSKKNKKD